MLNTIEALSELFRGSFLESQPIRRFEIDESDEFAFVIHVPTANALAAWQLLRSYLGETDRYPLLVEGWGYENYFARFYYQEEASEGKLIGTSPRTILDQVSMANLDAFLDAKRMDRQDNLEDEIDESLLRTREHFGSSPDSSQLKALIAEGVLRSTIDLEQWLFDWELKNMDYRDAIAPLDSSHLDWFEPGGETATLVLLPVSNGWDSLAYIHWFGACSTGTTVAICFLKQWYEQYGAELVCHYGTMLQLTVARPPQTPEVAFELAWQQEAIAECTTMLSGISLRDQARSLLMRDRWFLHERP